MASKFHPGDEVAIKIFISNHNESLKVGDVGTVVFCDYSVVGVDWHKNLICGHSCSGLCAPKHGWNMLTKELELVDKGISIPVSVDDFI